MDDPPMEIDDLLRVQRDLSILFGSTSDSKGASNILLEAVARMDGIDAAAVYFVDGRDGSLRLFAHKGLSASLVEKIAHCGPETEQAKIALKGEPVYRSNPGEFRNGYAVFEEEGLRAVGAIPLECEGKALGLLVLASRELGEMGEGRRGAIETAAAQFGSALARVQLAEKLRQSEKRFRQLAENLHEVFWVETPDELLYVSPAYEEIWGQKRKVLFERPESFWDSIHADDRERVEKAFGSEFDRGSPVCEEFRIVRSDGSTRWIRARSFPIEEGKGLYRRVGFSDTVILFSFKDWQKRMSF